MYIEVHYEDETDKKLAQKVISRLESDDSWLPTGTDDPPDIWIIDDDEPEIPDSPCTHMDALVGTVGAGSTARGPHVSAVTCNECVIRTQGWAQMRTGFPAEPLLTFENARKQHA